MKTSKIILTLCLAACLGLAFSAAAQAEPDQQPAAEAAAAAPVADAPPPELPTTASTPPPLPPDLQLKHIEPPKLPVSDAKPPELPPMEAIPLPELPEEEPSDEAAAAPQAEAASQPPPAAPPAAAPQTEIMTDPAAMPSDNISLFSHKFHVGAGLDCASCHNGIFQQAAGAAKAAGDFNMAAFAQGKYCGACHDGGMAFSTKDQAHCSRCHGSDMQPPKEPVVFKKPVEAVVFDHVRHNQEYGLACADCHETLFKMKRGNSEEQPDFTMQAMYDGKYCGACHNGAAAFAANTRCGKCHIGVKGAERLSGKKDAGHGKGH